MNSFRFASAVSQFVDQDTLVVKVPGALADKGALLAWYANQLQFPDYFSNNWDAYEEYLNDLSWLDACGIVLLHTELPLQSRTNELKTYLHILADTDKKRSV